MQVLTEQVVLGRLCSNLVAQVLDRVPAVGAAWLGTLSSERVSRLLPMVITEDVTQVAGREQNAGSTHVHATLCLASGHRSQGKR